MKNIYLLSALALACSLPAEAQTVLTDADIANSYSAKTYSHRVSCHDPSIVMDNITNPSSPVFYVYGSHLGHGSTSASSNYLDWDASWAAGEVAGTTRSLFADANGNLINYADAYGNAHSWQYSGNSVQGMQWAPDIIYNKTMKKWCLYMSLNGDNWCSSIVLFTSDSPQGPWQNQGVVNYSGFSGRFNHNGYTKSSDFTRTDLPKVTGSTTTLPARYNIPQGSSTSWGNVYPNDIDPCVFYDDDDNLWMSYGSWSGGIFLLRLDPATGLRDYTYKPDYKTQGTATTAGANTYNVLADPYFGTKIAGGHYVSGEGSYIQKIGSYYFLFMSYGGLNPSQGYQIRVFRSSTPEGPYVDTNGTSAIFSSYALNYGANATDNRGVLLMDGYQWETMPRGEVAQGHNSAFVDDKGRAFVVYHTKFNDGSFGHEVRIHQLFLNEDGWPVAAPYEFHGETATVSSVASTASVAGTDIPGDYQFIRHQYNQSHAAVSSSNQATTAKLTEPVDIHLSADGKVTGTGISNGTWTRKAGTDFITLTLSGVSYKGVLVRETIDYTDIPALCIAAISDDSGANGTRGGQTRQVEVWASKAETKAAIKYTLDKTQLPFQDGATINSNVSLPETGHLGTKVNWTSSDINVFDPDFGEITGKGPVTLTMNIEKDGCTYSKEFSLMADKDAQASTPVYYPESQQKNLTAGFWTNFSTQYYTLKAGSDVEFKFYNYSSKADNWDNWILGVANGERASSGYTEYLMLRNDNYGWTPTANTTDKSWYTSMTSNYNWGTFKEEMDGSLVDMTVSLATNGTFTVKANITAKSGNVYNYNFVMPISSKPSQVTLFFVSEKSYIDGTGLSTGIPSVRTTQARHTDKTYNTLGQQVDSHYRGIVIVDGKKILRK